MSLHWRFTIPRGNALRMLQRMNTKNVIYMSYRMDDGRVQGYCRFSDVTPAANARLATAGAWMVPLLNETAVQEAFNSTGDTVLVGSTRSAPESWLFANADPGFPYADLFRDVRRPEDYDGNCETVLVDDKPFRGGKLSLMIADRPYALLNRYGVVSFAPKRLVVVTEGSVDDLCIRERCVGTQFHHVYDGETPMFTD